MIARRFSLLASTILTLTCVALHGCAANAPADDAASASDDLTGSLGRSRACAVENAYELASSPAYFTQISLSELPDGVKAHIGESFMGAASVFRVAELGIVYVIEPMSGVSQASMLFYDYSGNELVQASLDRDAGHGRLKWVGPTGVLSCVLHPSVIDAGSPMDASTRDADAGHSPLDAG